MTRRVLPGRSLRATVAAAVLGLAVVIGLPAPARADSPTCSFSQPGENDVLGSSSVSIGGICTMSNGGTVVGDIHLSLDGPGGYRETTVPASGSESAGFSWNVDLPHNGSYNVAVQATGRDSSRDNSLEAGSRALSFKVEAVPSAPKSVRATVNSETRHVAVSWAANPEPDITGYRVFRTKGSGNFENVATPTAPNWTDTSTSEAGGEYRYRVVAVRSGARNGTTVTSDPSASVTADVPDPPRPAPEPGPGDPGTGGGGGTGEPTSPTQPGGGGTGGTGTTSGTGGTAPSGGSSSGSPRASVDLSQFASLLNRAQQTPTQPAPEIDGGFEETLPFAPPTTTELDDEGEVAAPDLGDRPLPVGNVDTRSGLRIFALGLLFTVLFMHVMFIKGQVAAADRLEALALEAETAA